MKLPKEVFESQLNDHFSKGYVAVQQASPRDVHNPRYLYFKSSLTQESLHFSDWGLIYLGTCLHSARQSFVFFLHIHLSLPNILQKCKGPLLMNLQTSSWFIPSSHPISCPTRGLLLIVGFQTQGPPLILSGAWKGGQYSGSQALHPLPRAGRKPAPTSGQLVVTHLEESTPPHRTQERQKSFHYRTQFETSDHKGHLHMQSDGPFQTLLPACPTATINVVQLLQSTNILCMDFFFFFSMETSSLGYLLDIPPWTFPLAICGLPKHLDLPKENRAILDLSEHIP
jgi:hypothetical protein